MDSLHLDSSSFHVDGNYIHRMWGSTTRRNWNYLWLFERPPSRPEAIYFRLVQWDGDIPLYLRVGDGNESDSAMFATSSRTSNGNGKSMPYLWRMPHLHARESATNVSFALGVESTRHPDCCKTLLENMPEEAFNSVISGYRIAPCCSEYGGVRQRWLVVESQARKMLTSNSWKNVWLNTYQKPNPNFGCCLNKNLLAQSYALIAAERLSHKLPLHQLADIQVKEVKKHTERGRPSKDACPTFYQVDALLELKETALAVEIKRAGRFILATNVIDTKELSDDDALRIRHSSLLSAVSGFSKTLYFLLRVFLNSTERVTSNGYGFVPACL